MARGTQIVVTSNPKGVFLEGIVSGTPFPGMVAELTPAVAPVGGRHTWRARSLASGAKGGVFVFREDDLQGKLGVGAPQPGAVPFSGGTQPYAGSGLGDAYVSGTRCFLYAPIMGEEMNVVRESAAGTADDVAIGDLFSVNNVGKLIPTTSVSAPFQAMEVISDPTADYLLWCLYLGNNA